MSRAKYFTEEQVKTAVAESFSYRSVAEKLGYNKNSGNYVNCVKK